MPRIHNLSNVAFFLILGPPNAGKTTLMYRLYSGIFYNTIQVVKRNIEEVKVDNVRLRALNIVENNLTMETWEPLASGCSGIILIIDITSDNLQLSKTLFQEIRSTPELTQLPLVIFANKIDLQQYNEHKLTEEFKLPETYQDVESNLQAISCKTTEGIIEGMNWLMEKTGIYFHIPTFRK